MQQIASTQTVNGLRRRESARMDGALSFVCGPKASRSDVLLRSCAGDWKS